MRSCYAPTRSRSLTEGKVWWWSGGESAASARGRCGIMRMVVCPMRKKVYCSGRAETPCGRVLAHAVTVTERDPCCPAARPRPPAASKQGSPDSPDILLLHATRIPSLTCILSLPFLAHHDWCHHIRNSLPESRHLTPGPDRSLYLVALPDLQLRPSPALNTRQSGRERG